MPADHPQKTIRHLIGQTPLIINPDRDAPAFQNALAALSTEKLQSFYRGLSGEDRRRFHYVANICLGFESWSRLYQELVVLETQARLTDRLEDAFAQRAEELRRREEDLQAERGNLEGEVLRLDRENQTLRQQNFELQKELATLQETCQALKRQQQQLLAIVERYKVLLQEFKSFMPPSASPK
jgi:SMC interacting uncharacterized protein involved in chromosome segregation